MLVSPGSPNILQAENLTDDHNKIRFSYLNLKIFCFRSFSTFNLFLQLWVTSRCIVFFFYEVPD